MIKKIIIGIISLVVIFGVLTYPINPKPLTEEEYQALLKMYKYEIEEGGVVMGRVTEGNVQNIFHKKIRERELTREEGFGYKAEREVLLKRAEEKKTNLFRKLI